jgi:raffinose/stachyose/melibiose transport system substrate-binding protein
LGGNVFVSLKERSVVRLLSLFAVLALIAAACSPAGDDGATGSTEGSASTEAPAETTTSAMAEPVELTFSMGNVEANVQSAEALIDAFMAANPDITIDLDSSGPTGSEGDNLVKTRLATGEMTDLFWYNTGSLFQALNPDETLLNVADEPWVGSINDAFLQTVSTDSGVYGPPVRTAMGGGVLYYIPDYEELGLEVPTTWDEFMANNQALLDAGKVPVIQSYADTWTSQLFVLADFYNVQAADPDWAEKYTAGEAKYADEPGLKGFERLQEVYEAGFLNEDFASATFDDALRMVGAGEGTHYPMLTFAVSTIVDLYPEAVENLGFFALPGDGPNGLTVWMPSAIYAPTTTEHPEEVKRFLSFVASVDACERPTEVPRAVADMAPYFEAEGATSPALEFLSPIKGPSLEQITVEVGSGIRSAEDGAALYDEDVKKQAQQLGLPGWDD